MWDCNNIYEDGRRYWEWGVDVGELCLNVTMFSTICQAHTAKEQHHNHSKHHADAKDVSSWSTWSTDMESAIDSSFFWGYLVTQIPGGFLASFFPANRIFGAAIVGSAFCNMFIPLCIYLNPIILICVRVVQGLVEVSSWHFEGSLVAKTLTMFVGRDISGLPWHLAILGTAAWTVTPRDDCVQRLVCGRCDRLAGVRLFGRSQLAGAVLFLQYGRIYMVNAGNVESKLWYSTHLSAHSKCPGTACGCGWSSRSRAAIRRSRCTNWSTSRSRSVSPCSNRCRRLRRRRGTTSCARCPCTRLSWRTSAGRGTSTCWCCIRARIWSIGSTSKCKRYEAGLRGNEYSAFLRHNSFALSRRPDSLERCRIW